MLVGKYVLNHAIENQEIHTSITELNLKVKEEMMNHTIKGTSMSDAATQAAMSIEDHWGELIYAIVVEAEDRFKKCDEENDFCIQTASTVIVFGGTNRVIWSPQNGFRPDRSYCRDAFLELWDQHYPNTKKIESLLPKVQGKTLMVEFKEGYMQEHMMAKISEIYDSTHSFEQPLECRPLEWDALWEAMKDNPTKWVPTTEHMYDQMLCALPPEAQSSKGFLCGEPYTHNAEGHAVYAAFMRKGESYFAKYLTVREFKKES